MFILVILKMCSYGWIQASRWEYEVLPHIVFAFLGVGKRSEEKVLAGFFGVEETKEQAGNCSEIQFAGLVSVFLIFKGCNGIYFSLNSDPGADLHLNP